MPQRIQPQAEGARASHTRLARRRRAPGACQRSRRPDPARATEEDLLILYLAQPAGDQLIARLVDAGGQLVPAPNPYWHRWRVTIADPDGYWLVLSHHR